MAGGPKIYWWRAKVHIGSSSSKDYRSLLLVWGNIWLQSFTMMRNIREIYPDISRYPDTWTSYWGALASPAIAPLCSFSASSKVWGRKLKTNPDPHSNFEFQRQIQIPYMEKSRSRSASKDKLNPYLWSKDSARRQSNNMTLSLC